MLSHCIHTNLYSAIHGVLIPNNWVSALHDIVYALHEDMQLFYMTKAWMMHDIVHK